MEYSKKSSKISDIVRLHQVLKKWKKLANNNSNNNPSKNTIHGSSSSTNPIKFIKRTLSFTDVSSFDNETNNVPKKGYIAVCVGKELKRYTIPTEYLSHQAFGVLLREAEEEFGFQQEGVLKFPCEVFLFEKILKIVQDKKSCDFGDLHDQFGFGINGDIVGCYTNSPDSCESITPSSHHPQLCR